MRNLEGEISKDFEEAEDFLKNLREKMNAGVRWMSKRWPKRRQDGENVSVSLSNLDGQGVIFQPVVIF